MIKFRDDVTIAEADFLKWALRQDSGRPINHTGWRYCSVGEYAKACGDWVPGRVNGYDCPPTACNWTEYAYRHLPDDLYGALDAEPRLGQIVFYDDLQRFIRKQYVVGLTDPHSVLF